MTTKTKLPKFEGRPLAEIPEVIPVANFLTGDFGRAALEEYESRVRDDYDDNSTLDVLTFRDDVIKGSNPYAVVLMNRILGEEGIRTATPADLQRILDTNALDLSGFYEDAALVLRNEDSPNEYLARNLTEQIRERQGKKAKMPVMVSLADLELEKDSDAPDGLAFRLRDNAKIVYVPILNKDGYFSSGDVDVKTGLPTKLGEGDRHLYKADSGLSRLFLDRCSGLYASWNLLLGSSGDGRVVGVSGVEPLRRIYSKA